MPLPKTNATHTHRGIYSNTSWGHLYIHVSWSTIYDIHGMDSALDTGKQIDGKENNVYAYILFHYIYYICNMLCVCLCETVRINDNAWFSGKWISLEIILCKIIQIQKDKYWIFLSFVGPRILFRYNTRIYMHKHTWGRMWRMFSLPVGTLQS